jgi:hypothetical protein
MEDAVFTSLIVLKACPSFKAGRQKGRAIADPALLHRAEDYFRIFVTVPAPTVRPPSRIA